MTTPTFADIFCESSVKLNWNRPAPLPDRAVFAAEIAARLDFYEAAEAVTDLAETMNDERVLMSAADLAGSPYVGDDIRLRVARLAQGHGGGCEEAVAVRLDPHSLPDPSDKALCELRRTVWSGIDPAAGTPFVVIDEKLPKLAVLRTAVAAADSVGGVRRWRVPRPGANNGDGSPMPEWFGPGTVVAAADSNVEHVAAALPGLPAGRVVSGGDLSGCGDAAEVADVLRHAAALIDPAADRTLT